jgi:phosphomethylpyrimidine synthase
MKISQEVRDFAASEAAKSAAERPWDVSQADLIATSAEEAEAGMAEMSERYRAGGNELYIGANGREHD